jgi:hypothetical protein
MAISGQENINIGLPNEAANSDSLFTAFNKTQNNFSNLFLYASPYTSFVGATGISASANSNTATVTITNTGVTSIIAGSNVTIDQSNGAVTISAGGGAGSPGVSSVGIVGASGNARIIPSGTNPVVSAGTIVLDLTTTGVTPGTYTYPTLSVDDWGRINNISNGNSVGTVTSVGVIAGPGMLVTGSPVTTTGEITIVNTGVVRLNAGSGISLTDSTGNITISTAQGVGTVTSIDIVSSTLNVSGSPIVSSGSVIIDLPGNLKLPGSENLQDGDPANLNVVASYFTTVAPSTATLADGTEGQIKTFMMVADGGDMVITVANAGWSGSGTVTFGDQGDGCTLQYVNGKWYCVGNNGVTFG